MNNERSRIASDRDNLVVKVTDSWPACHETEPNTAEDPLGRHKLIQSKMTRRRGLTNEEMKKKLEESDDKDIDLYDEIDDTNFQDPAHNLQYSSNSDECEMDIDHDTIP
ncbi:piggyBac transposable element-derived protein 4 [Trichonephila clavata]|uniref:PiggyBac transposable element-derived protein 4 n=1 Tax=Trichonephila clavata TaxID=2740835 RepID=A0A8X6EXW8_TRICU|nr:piggyBac transposable element-derived protein 4 [Trichonephila clavata]